MPTPVPDPSRAAAALNERSGEVDSETQQDVTRPDGPDVDGTHPTGTLSTVAARLRAAGCVFAEDEATLLLAATADSAALDELVRRRAEGEPLEHLLGWAEFCGLRITVRPGVFVPRRRTEFLVQQALSLLPGADTDTDTDTAIVVDLCCGCGAIGRAVAARRPGVTLVAADIDPVAAACAEENIAPIGGRVFIGDLYRALPDELRGRIELLVVNAPYVPTDAIAMMPPEARDHEPSVALDGGADGTAVQVAVAAGAPDWLAPGGSLLIEAGQRQAASTAAAFTASGLLARVTHDDDRDATVVIGVLPAVRTPPAAAGPPAPVTPPATSRR